MMTTSTSADGFVLNDYSRMYGKHRSAKEIPSLQKTVKIKQAKPYYRSLQEHCWVSREWETERVKEGEREGEGNHAGQSLTLTMCTEMKGLKLNPHIPLALWQASEKCCCCCSAHVIPYYLTSARHAAVYLLSRVTLWTSFSPSLPVRSAHFWTTHSNSSNSQPNPMLLSLPLCQGFHPGQWEKRQPHATTRCHKHIVAEGNTIHQLARMKTSMHSPLSLMCNLFHSVDLENPIIHFL